MKMWLLRFYTAGVLVLFATMPALAQDEVAGQMVTQEDWWNFMPVFIGSIIVVIVVDAFFIIPIFRKSDDTSKDTKS